jgi:hypothetical protein
VTSLKPPVWTWEIPTYFFVGGVAGVAALVAGVASIAGANPWLVRDARWVAVGGAIVSPLLLVSDLGRPARFLYMLRVFKTQSAMSVGVWTLVVFSAVVSAAVGWSSLSGLPLSLTATGRIAGLILDVACIITGLALATYPGVLLGATAVPIWARHARILPAHFGASSLGAGIAVLELLGHRIPALNVIGLAAALAETILSFRIHLRRELQSEESGRLAIRLTRLGELLSGPVALILRGVALTFAPWPITTAAAAAAIAGSICTRYGWVAAGRASVRAVGR